MREVSVIFTEYTGLFPRLIHLFDCGVFTHSSIGLEGLEGNHYSFNYRGFTTENLQKFRRQRIMKSRGYTLQVSDAVYQDLVTRLQIFCRNKEQYHYSGLGAISCMLRLPLPRRNHYFCSQFVAQLLKESGALPLKKRPCLYLPNQLAKELDRSEHCDGGTNGVV